MREGGDDAPSRGSPTASACCSPRHAAARGAGRARDRPTSARSTDFQSRSRRPPTALLERRRRRRRRDDSIAAELAAFTTRRQHAAEPRRSRHEGVTEPCDPGRSDAIGSRTRLLRPPFPRRQLASAIGAAASARPRWRRCSNPRSLAGDGLPALPHFAPQGASASSGSRRPGAPSQLDLFDYKPGLKDAVRQGPARLGPRRAAADRHDRRADALSRRAVALQVPAARRGGNVAERAAAAHGANRRRALRHPLAAHRGHQSRPGDDAACRPGIRSPGRPSLGAWLSYGLGSRERRTCPRSS